MLVDDSIGGVTKKQRKDRCRACEGRGWKLVTARRLVRVAESAVTLAPLPCPDCLGQVPDQSPAVV